MDDELLAPLRAEVQAKLRETIQVYEAFPNKKGFYYVTVASYLAYGFWNLRVQGDGTVSETPDPVTSSDIPARVFESVATRARAELARSDFSAAAKTIATAIEAILATVARACAESANGQLVYVGIASSLLYVDPNTQAIVPHAEILRSLHVDPSKAESAVDDSPAQPRRENLPPKALREAELELAAMPGSAALQLQYARSLIANDADRDHLAVRLLLSSWSAYQDDALELLRERFFQDAVAVLIPYRALVRHFVDMTGVG